VPHQARRMAPLLSGSFFLDETAFAFLLVPRLSFSPIVFSPPLEIFSGFKDCLWTCPALFLWVPHSQSLLAPFPLLTIFKQTHCPPVEGCLPIPCPTKTIHCLSCSTFDVMFSFGFSKNHSRFYILFLSSFLDLSTFLSASKTPYP